MSGPAGGAAGGPSPGDRVALRAQVDAYAVAVDRRDAAGFVAVFTEDATLSTYEPDGRRRGIFRGHDELAAVPAALAHYERTLHLVSTHLVEPAPGGDADEAAGTAYCEAHHHRAPDPTTGSPPDQARLAARYSAGVPQSRNGPSCTTRSKRPAACSARQSTS